jgi:hypothetical protein
MIILLEFIGAAVIVTLIYLGAAAAASRYNQRKDSDNDGN